MQPYKILIRLLGNSRRPINNQIYFLKIIVSNISKNRIWIVIKNDKIKVIIISGPSGSGKTTLSNQILLKIKNGIILGTDNYYKTGLISKFLSKFVKGYFDKRISFNYKLFKNDFNFIIKNGISIRERSYNFKNKSTKHFIREKNNIEFLIIEGIFAREFSKIYLIQIIFS